MIVKWNISDWNGGNCLFHLYLTSLFSKNWIKQNYFSIVFVSHTIIRNYIDWRICWRISRIFMWGYFIKNMGLFRPFIYKYEYTELRPFTALTHRFGSLTLPPPFALLTPELSSYWRLEKHGERLTNLLQLNKSIQPNNPTTQSKPNQPNLNQINPI